MITAPEEVRAARLAARGREDLDAFAERLRRDISVTKDASIIQQRSSRDCRTGPEDGL